MRKTDSDRYASRYAGLSKLLAPVFALFAGRHGRFFAAVLATALVGVTLSPGSARANDACIPYVDKYEAVLEENRSNWEERNLYLALADACLWGDVNRAEEIRESSACLSYHSHPSGSDENYLYSALWDACWWGGENRAEEIRESGACVSYNRKYFNAPWGSDEHDLYRALFYACLEGGENRAEKVREERARGRYPCDSYWHKFLEARSSGFDETERQRNLWKACVRTSGYDPCDSYYDKYEASPADSYALILYDILYYACDRGGERTVTRVRKHLERGLNKSCHWYRIEYIRASGGSHTEDLYSSLEYACKQIEEAGVGYLLKRNGRGGRNLLDKVREEGGRGQPEAQNSGFSIVDKLREDWGRVRQCHAGVDTCLLDKVHEEGGRGLYEERDAKARETREASLTREAGLTQEERDALEEALAASFGVRDFQKLADDVIKTMGTDRGLKEALGGTKPPLLIASIENRSGAEIDAQLIHNLVRVRLNRERLFELVRRDHLETLLQEQTLGDLVDADTAAQVGRTLGAQYMLHGSIADDIRTLESGGLQIVYTLTLIVTEIETGLDTWIDEAEVIKTS